MNPPESWRIAVIDLGSNTARVIVMICRPGYSFHLEDEIREVVRLREGMTEAGLSEAAMRRGLVTLRLFKRFCDSVGADRILATATSAVREAANGPEFLQRVRDEIGISLRLLSGEEEALYGVLGALNTVPLTDGAVLDIGGGSAQVSQVRGRRFLRGQALTLGALALTERFVRSDPPRRSEIRSVQAEINRQLDEVPWIGEEHGPLVGLGGTIRSLAKIDAARSGYPLESINGYALSVGALDGIIRQLAEATITQRRRVAGMVRDRADIILQGALVVRAVAARLGVPELRVAEGGLREGQFFEQFWTDLPEPLTPDLRAFGVLNLARFYGYHEAHAEHVRHLATRVFDSLVPLHGYGEWERELLSAAAILHDIGMAIRYNDHHKYSQMLVAANGLTGYSAREVALIAQMTRYHRKGTPSAGEFASLMEPGDDLRLTRLSSMLRLAEYLERGRAGIVRDIEARWDAERIWLWLVADEYPAVEIWEAQRSALDLLASAMGKQILLESHPSARANAG